MSSVKRGASSPPNKENKKQKEEDCLICSEEATENVLECLWCDGRVHGKCVKISEEQIILLGNARNVVFFCNTCLNTLPTALKYFEDLSPIDSRITNVEKSITEIQSTGNQTNKEFQQFSKQNQEVANQISNLTTRINQLVSNNNQIQTQIEDMKVAIHKKCDDKAAQQPPNANVDPPSQTSVSGTTLTILEELADRERRRNNVIIYNMPESSDPQSDQGKFKELCSTAFGIDVNLNKTTRLGKKIDNKQRPILVCLDDPSVRDAILNQTGKLRKYEQFKNVFIVPDRTKFEREKHQKLVNELKQRRASGEQNLVIRNGNIVVYHRSRPSGTTSERHS